MLPSGRVGHLAAKISKKGNPLDPITGTNIYLCIWKISSGILTCMGHST